MLLIAVAEMVHKPRIADVRRGIRMVGDYRQVKKLAKGLIRGVPSFAV